MSTQCHIKRTLSRRNNSRHCMSLCIAKIDKIIELFRTNFPLHLLVSLLALPLICWLNQKGNLWLENQFIYFTLLQNFDDIFSPQDWCELIYFLVCSVIIIILDVPSAHDRERVASSKTHAENALESSLDLHLSSIFHFYI